MLVYRIMKLIIAEQGNNAWLAHGTPRRECGEGSVVKAVPSRQRRVRLEGADVVKG
jgi:hypothetical protein